MTILAIDEQPEALKNLADNLQAVFPREPIVTFRSPLLALQYAGQHPEEIGLVFSALAMRLMDGITLAQTIRTYAPGAAVFFAVNTVSDELAEIVKQHGNGTCLPKPITVESIQKATEWLHEPCPWEDEDCEERCVGEWCNRKKRKASV